MRPALNFTRRVLEKCEGIICAEIGVLRGENSREILTEWGQIKTMYLIDNYQDGWIAYPDAQANLSPWKDKLVWLLEDSVTAISRFADNSFDFIYIDGDHSYEGVKRDMIAVWPKIREGGVMSGHDYNPRWDSLAGVIRAVDEFENEMKLMKWVETSGSSSDWAFVKEKK